MSAYCPHGQFYEDGPCFDCYCDAQDEERAAREAAALAKGTTMSDERYPQHAKLRARREEHEHVQAFLQWCEDEGITVCQVDAQRRYGDYTPVAYVPQLPEDVIARYFEIDRDAFEAEKQAMLIAAIDR